MFHDRIRIWVNAGKGGDGASSFRREKFVPRGGADGGDGGRGGDVIIRSTASVKTLSHMREGQKISATPGGNGRGRKFHGERGADAIIDVPLGTLVFQLHDDGTYGACLADLVHDGDKFTVAKGGKAGIGNTHFVTPIQQAPTTADRGLPGEKLGVILEIKLIADVGFVGIPNAGKSTLLGAISNAKPKTADYPFTTLEPHLGVMKKELAMPRNPAISYTPIVLADIPGLIEGASEGKGLGHTFLKHIERTRLLALVIDASLGKKHITDTFKQLTNELAKFSRKLSEKRTLLVLNKIDELSDKESKALLVWAIKKYSPVSVVGISAFFGIGIEELSTMMIEQLANLPQDYSLSPILHILEPTYFPITIEHIDEVYIVHHKPAENIVLQTYTDNEGSLDRMMSRLSKLGVVDALEKAGVEEGDEVEIAGKVFTWV